MGWSGKREEISLREGKGGTQKTPRPTGWWFLTLNLLDTLLELYTDCSGLSWGMLTAPLCYPQLDTEMTGTERVNGLPCS